MFLHLLRDRPIILKFRCLRVGILSHIYGTLKLQGQSQFKREFINN